MKIIKYNPNKNPNSVLQAFFTIQVPQWHNVIIEEMQYFKRGDNRWVAFPAKKYERDGQTKYFHYIHLENSVTYRAFSAAVCKAIDNFLLQGPSVFTAFEEKRSVQTPPETTPPKESGIPF